VAAAQVAIALRAGAGEIEAEAARDLHEGLPTATSQPAAGTRFTVVLGVLDGEGKLLGRPVKGAARLRDLPHRTQAYVIEPAGGDGLLLAALDEVGVLYAAQTLRQLITPGPGAAEVTIPLVEVADWPDLDERGVWNHPDVAVWLRWMSQVKLNYSNHAPDVALEPVERGQPARARLSVQGLAEARRRGFRLVPQITHLNFLHTVGLFRAYPELAGRGDRALAGYYHAHRFSPDMHRVPNPGDPKLVEILSDWMIDLADQGAPEVCGWLTERPAEDDRPATRDVGQFVLEARAYVAAWRRAREKHPGLGLRLFISTTSFERDYVILAQTPTEVKIIRCCISEAERVRHLPRDLFRNPLYDAYAAEGRWIGTYDVPLNVNGNVETPEFKLPERSAHRIRDYVRQIGGRGYQGAAGLMAWARLAREICEFNITALAEWAWNRDGRDEHEFALAYAVRKGWRDPEAFARWSDLMGPLEWDVYDSQIPECYSWDLAVEGLRRKDWPVLGEGMFRYYRTPEEFDRKLAVCDEAAALAQGLDDPDLARETRVVRSYADLARGVWRVWRFTVGEDLTRLDAQAELRNRLAALRAAGQENAAAIRAWRAALGPEPWHRRVYEAIASSARTVDEICRTVEGSYLY